MRWYDANGVQRSKTVDSMAEAKIVRDSKRQRVTMQRMGVEPPEGFDMKVDELFDRFEKEKVPVLRPSSQKAYRDAMRKLRPLIGRVHLKDCTTGRLVKLQRQLIETGAANASVNQVVAVIRAALNWAVLIGVLPYCPANRVPKLPDGRKSQTAIKHARLTVEEVERLVEVALAHDEETKPKVPRAPLIIAAAETGMRVGELVGLCWRSILPGAIVVEAESSKTGERTVPVSERLQKALDGLRKAEAFILGRMPGPDDRVFLDPKGAPLKTKCRWSFGSHLTRLVKRAGLPHMDSERGNTSFHSLRHTVATHLFEAGVKPQHVMKLLGHASIATTMRYADTRNVELGGAMEALKAYRTPRSHDAGEDRKSQA